MPWLATALFLLNAGIAWKLFRTEYLAQMGTPEGTLIAYARYARDHWINSAACRSGMRAFRPRIPIAGPASDGGRAIRVRTSERRFSIHLVEALMYSLGAVTLFWMACRRS